MEQQAPTRVMGMLSMGMTLAIATAALVIVSGITGGADLARFRELAFMPLAMFAVGVGNRFVGSLLMRDTRRPWSIALGDILAALIAVAVFAVVASVHDGAKVVLFATVIIVAVAVPVTAVASLVSTAISRSRPLVTAAGGLCLCIGVAAIAVQATVYWTPAG